MLKSSSLSRLATKDLTLARRNSGGPPPLQADSPRTATPRDHGLAAFAREVGLRTPDSIATPQMAEQTGLSLEILRWVPVYVIGLGMILIAGIGLVVLTIL